jgi:pilus assembly protein CpaE
VKSGKVVLMNSPDSMEMSNDMRSLGAGSDARGTAMGGRAQLMSIAILDPNLERRNAVAGILCGLGSNAIRPRVTTLMNIEDFRSLYKQDFKIVFVAVDGDAEFAMKTVEAVCSSSSASVVGYSPSTNDNLLINCIRAGVREFLIYPFEPSVVEAALVRVSGRAMLQPETNKVVGKSFVFIGAKGGAGGTTAACNFAVSMAKDSRKETLLIDLDLPLGDASLVLGVAGEFSTVDALNDPERLDSTFLRKILAQHSSGLYVLGAPGQFVGSNVTREGIEKLIEVASKTFEYVVVDAGSRWDLAQTRVFDMVSTIYLVTQVGIAELRNANRLITGCLQPYSQKLEVVLNRFKDMKFGIEFDAIEKALTRPAEWRIPNDYAAVQEMQNTATPLALKESRIQRAIQKMAQIASELPDERQQKKRKFGLFGFASGV